MNLQTRVIDPRFLFGLYLNQQRAISNDSDNLSANEMTEQNENFLHGSKSLALFLALFGYVPFLALTLAVGPLNPFLSQIIGQYALPSWYFAHVLTFYGAVILSFLGGIRWGVAMVGAGETKLRSLELTLSVVPSLAGWFAVFMPRSEALYFLAFCFLVQGIWDLFLVAQNRAPQWFKTLRLLLTILVTLTLFIAGLIAS